jgi:hypothetical protein
MQRITSKLAVAAGGVVAMLANAASVLAQYEDLYDYDYTYDSTASSAAGTGLGLAMMAFWCCTILISLGYFVFTIMMVIHASKHAPEDQKILWILLMLFVPVLSLIYFFTKKKEWEGGAVSAPKSETPPAE